MVRAALTSSGTDIGSREGAAVQRVGRARSFRHCSYLALGRPTILTRYSPKFRKVMDGHLEAKWVEKHCLGPLSLALLQRHSQFSAAGRSRNIIVYHLLSTIITLYS